MKCPKCNNENINIQLITEKKKTSCFTIFLYLILAISILGWFVLIPIWLGKKETKQSYAVCQKCGHTWKPTPDLKCKYCKKDVSINDINCPHCGKKIRNSQKENIILILISIFALIIAFLFF